MSVESLKRLNSQNYRERGAMLLLVAALLFNLTIVALITLNGARSGFYRAIDMQRRAQAVCFAEAGLSAGAREIVDMESLDDLPLPYLVQSEVVFADGIYQVELNNNADDGGDTADTDGLFILRATGWSFGGTRHRVIEAVVIDGVPALDVPGAMTIGVGAVVQLFGANVIQGTDVDGSGISVAGVAFEVAGQTLGSTDGSSSVAGSPDWSWADDVFTADAGFSTYAQKAVGGFASGASSVHLAANDALTGVIGRPASPQITVVDPGVSVSIPSGGTVSGAGILVIRGAFDVKGDFMFRGLVLIEGSAGPVVFQGTGEIQGALVVTAPRIPPTIETLRAQDDGLTVRYSQAVVAWVNENLPTRRVQSYTLTN